MLVFLSHSLSLCFSDISVRIHLNKIVDLCMVFALNHRECFCKGQQ